MCLGTSLMERTGSFHGFSIAISGPEVDDKLRARYLLSKRASEEKDLVTYYKMVTPILAVQQLFGRLPCFIKKEGLARARESPFQCLYCLLLWTLQCTYAIISIRKVVMVFLKKRQLNPILINVILAISQVFIIPLCYWVDSGLLVDYVNHWTHFQVHYERVMHGQLKFKSTKLVSYSTALSIPMAVIFIFVNQHFMLGLEIIDNLVTLAPIMVSFEMVNVLWVVTLQEIRAIADVITYRLLRPETRGKEAGELRLLWQEAKSLTAELGDVLGTSSLAFSISSFVNVLTVFYCIIIAPSLDPYVIFIVLITIGFSIIFIFYLEMIHRTTEAVGIKLAQKLLREESITLRSQHYTREIRLILETIQTYKPKITFKGFFVADRNLIIVGIKSIVTYIIILLQSLPRTTPAEIQAIYTHME